MLPQIIVIGAMKAATTSLFHYLSLHPDLVASSIKETNFFRSEKNFAQGLGWYESLFQQPGKVAFEASPGYTKRHLYPGVPERIHATLPNAKLIYVLRDPVKRIASHHMHTVAEGKQPLSLSEVIRKPNSNYLQTSKYFFQLEAYLPYFPKEQIYLIEAESLAQNTVDSLNTLCRFLQIDEAYDTTMDFQRAHESSIKLKPSSLEMRLAPMLPHPKWKSLVNKLTQPLRQPVTKPEISEADRKFINDALSEDVEKLRDFSGLSLETWLK